MGLDEGEGVGLACSLADLLISGDAVVPYVLPEGAAEDGGLLTDHSEEAAEVPQIVVLDVAAAQVDGSLSGLVEPQQQLDDGRLPAPRGSHEGRLLTLLQFEADVPEDELLPVLVLEADPFEPYASHSSFFDHGRLFALLHLLFVLLVQNIEQLRC